MGHLVSQIRYKDPLHAPMHASAQRRKSVHLDASLHSDITERLVLLLLYVRNHKFADGQVVAEVLTTEFIRLLQPQRDRNTGQRYTAAGKLGLSADHVKSALAAVNDATLLLSAQEAIIALRYVHAALASWNRAAL
jgi:hypothetical protein